MFSFEDWKWTARKYDAHVQMTKTINQTFFCAGSGVDVTFSAEFVFWSGCLRKTSHTKKGDFDIFSNFDRFLCHVIWHVIWPAQINLSILNSIAQIQY